MWVEVGIDRDRKVRMATNNDSDITRGLDKNLRIYPFAALYNKT